MAKDEKQNSAATNLKDTGADAVSLQGAAKAPSKEVDEGMLVSFNPSAAVKTFVLEDGTRIEDGDVVESGVFSQLKDVELDGDSLLLVEEGE